jgi:hypothetical protein
MLQFAIIFVQVLMALIYLSIDISFYVTDQPEDHVACDLPVKNFPGVVHDDGIIRFQCHGKKTSFFKIALLSQVPVSSILVHIKKLGHST